MKKILAILVALIGITALSGCTLKEPTLIQDEADIKHYAFLSAAEMIQTSVTDTSAIMSLPVESLNEDTDEPVDEPVTEEPEAPSEVTDAVLEKYLNLIETYLSNEAVTTEVIASDRVEYEFMVVYRVQDLLGETQSFTVYYNEVVLIEEQADELEDDIEEFDEEDDEEEMQTTSALYANNKGRHHEYDDDFEDDFDDEIETELTDLIVINDVE